MHASTSPPGRTRPALHLLTLVDAAALLQRGDLTAEAYAQALLQRCEDGRALHAFTALDGPALLTAARAADARRASGRSLGRLHGVPLAIKDNIDVAGFATTGGTSALRHTHPAADAEVVARLRAEGALVLGKNNLHELAMGWTSDNPHFGRVGNPHAPARLAGGSSGGSACAVAAGMAAAAIGTDTNGSSRVPAALCGIAGLRPSTGRYPTGGTVALSHTLDTVGPMARNVTDLALLDAVMAGEATARPCRDLAGLRIGLSPRYYWHSLAPELDPVLRRARDRLEARGVSFVHAEVEGLQALVAGTAPTLIGHEAPSQLAAYLQHHAPEVTLRMLLDGLGADLAPMLRPAPASPDPAQAAAYRAARERCTQTRARLASHFATHRLDLMMHPAVPMTAPVAPPHRVSPGPDVPLSDGRVLAARDAFARNISPASIAGLPSLVLRAGYAADGLPVGLLFDAPPQQDTRLLSLGMAIEAVLSGAANPDPDLSFTSKTPCT